MKSKSLVIFTTLFISSAFLAQNTQFMLQPNSINPATSGFFNQLSISGMGDIDRVGSINILNTSLNYNQKFEKLKGGIGANYTFQGFNDIYRLSIGEINYSFHAVEKERFRLGFGLGLSVDHERFQTLDPAYPSNQITATNNLPFLSAGTVAQFGNHTGQFSVRKLNFGDASGNEAIYASYSYNWKVSDVFSMKLGLLYYNQSSFNSLVFSAILKYKMVWLNLGMTNRDLLTVGAGVDIKDNFRVGAFLYNYFSPLSNGTDSSFGLFLSYRIKTKEKAILPE